MKITAIVITFNEEANIARALTSLAWADEIIVVDSESRDRTVELARSFTERVIVRRWPGYSAQKNFAAEQASHDWIFSLDADEEVSAGLRQAIESLKLAKDLGVAGFEVSRMAFYLGRWIRYSGWYPDWKLRLYDRRRARWVGDYVHEGVEVDGETARLNGDLLHFTVNNASEHHLRIDRYTTLAAEQAHARGKRAGLASLILSPPLTFIRSYLFKLGFLDGLPGYAIARFAAHYAFLKNLKLWELSKGKHRPADQ
ncbi:MAG TPA: glycosyltransferase family 2 protein [Blastocatellia bacterium]|nr:glycosyltransferase family 2 protein [Blastocatellia bacterium]